MIFQSKLMIITVFLQFVCGGLQAEDYTESDHLFREAMMRSNADYNKHKQKSNMAENERSDEWGERDIGAIQIYKVNGREITAAEEKRAPSKVN